MRTLATIVVLAGAIVGGSLTASADSTTGNRFTFMRPPAPASTVDEVDDQGRMWLDIQRWSSTAERDQLRAAAAADGIVQAAGALRRSPRVGTLRWPGGTEYAIHYARQTKRSDGGTDVVLVLDRPLWLWWSANQPSTTDPFTVIQMKLDARGRGEARASFGVSIAEDAAGGLALSDYATALPVFTDVKADRMDS